MPFVLFDIVVHIIFMMLWVETFVVEVDIHELVFQERPKILWLFFYF